MPIPQSLGEDVVGDGPGDPAVPIVGRMDGDESEVGDRRFEA
jgi:hypothetical protein